MSLAGAGAGSREGTRIGLWGAAQAVAFGVGGFAGTVAVDVARRLVASPLCAYDVAFLAEAVLFLAAAALASRIAAGGREPSRADAMSVKTHLVART